MFSLLCPVRPACCSLVPLCCSLLLVSGASLLCPACPLLPSQRFIIDQQPVSTTEAVYDRNIQKWNRWPMGALGIIFPVYRIRSTFRWWCRGVCVQFSSVLHFVRVVSHITECRSLVSRLYDELRQHQDHSKLQNAYKNDEMHCWNRFSSNFCTFER
jgi:hypothetical protein